MDKVSYALGIGIGRQLASMGAESLNIDDFAQAVKDAIAGKLQLDEQEADDFYCHQLNQHGPCELTLRESVAKILGRDSARTLYVSDAAPHF